MHPIHTEVVNSIFNRSEILVSLGVIGGLWWFLRTQPSEPKKAWLGLAVIYLLVLLCKESAVTLPAFAVVLLWTTLPDSWLQRLKKCLLVFLLLIPLGVYLVLRTNALEPAGMISEPEMATAESTSEVRELDNNKLSVIEDGDVRATEQPSEATEQSGLTSELNGKFAKQFSKLAGLLEDSLDLVDFDRGRLIYAVRLWADALKITLWPDPLILFHGNLKTSLWTALALQLALFVIAIAGFIYNRPGLFIGLAFFYIALLPSSGIVGTHFQSPTRGALISICLRSA